jgi:predicted nucleic acid-binding protein
LSTLAHAEASFSALPITEEIAREWGRLVTEARDKNRRAPINDVWIAATASVHGLVVVTQDRDYDGLDVPVLRV